MPIWREKGHPGRVLSENFINNDSGCLRGAILLIPWIKSLARLDLSVTTAEFGVRQPPLVRRPFTHADVEAVRLRDQGATLGMDGKTEYSAYTKSCGGETKRGVLVRLE